MHGLTQLDMRATYAFLHIKRYVLHSVLMMIICHNHICHDHVSWDVTLDSNSC